MRYQSSETAHVTHHLLVTDKSLVDARNAPQRHGHEENTRGDDADAWETEAAMPGRCALLDRPLRLTISGVWALATTLRVAALPKPPATSRAMPVASCWAAGVSTRRSSTAWARPHRACGPVLCRGSSASEAGPGRHECSPLTMPLSRATAIDASVVGWVKTRNEKTVQGQVSARQRAAARPAGGRRQYPQCPDRWASAISPDIVELDDEFHH